MTASSTCRRMRRSARRSRSCSGLDDPVIDIEDDARPRRLPRRARHRARSRGRRARHAEPPDRRRSPGSFDSPIRGSAICRPTSRRPARSSSAAISASVKNGPSPQWLQDRLMAIGLRPISALVDITNFVTFDLGRPLHVFDAEKLAGDLTMRFAQAGREDPGARRQDLRARRRHDGDRRRSRRCTASAASWAARPPAAPPTTTDVFLEVALFDPVRTARTGRKLGIESDARYRFERGLDPQCAVWGAEVGGAPDPRALRRRGEPRRQRRRRCRLAAPPRRCGPTRVDGLGGLDVPAAEAQRHPAARSASP